MEEVAQIVKKGGVFCLFSAAAHHDLTTFVSSEYHLAVPKKYKVVLPEYPPIKLYYWEEAAYQTGITKVVIEGEMVAMYDAEKTVCDIIKYQKKVGMDTLKEVLNTYLRRKDRNIHKLSEYASILKSRRKSTASSPFWYEKRCCKHPGRLKNIARSEQKNFQLLLIRYFQERMLYRLFCHKCYREHFCLKGGALLYALEMEKSRPTMDLDLLGLGLSRREADFHSIFRSILKRMYEEDGVTFDLDTITTEEIAKEGHYSGIRIKVLARLGNIRQNMQVDIGFGDFVTPAPVQMKFPTLWKWMHRNFWPIPRKRSLPRNSRP